MKQLATVFLTALLLQGHAHAMKMVDTPNTGGKAAPASPMQQGGKVDAIHAGASKIVIKGETFAYNPLTTIVTLNGKRATMSDVRVGETVKFQATSQGANKASLLTTVTLQR